jgi:hypothetical protein
VALVATPFLSSLMAWPMERDSSGSFRLLKERIETLRATCSACHAAEKHAFIKIAIPTVRLNPIEKP